MGGYGSGRRSDKPKVEECSSIDANQLNRDGYFKNGWNGTMTLSRNDVKALLLEYIHQLTVYISLTAPRNMEPYPSQ